MFNYTSRPIVNSLLRRRPLLSSSLLSTGKQQQIGRNFTLTRLNTSTTTTSTTSNSTSSPDEGVVAQQTENVNTMVESEAAENKSTITSGKSYNGIPLHKPPQHIKKLSFFGALARYTFYFIFSIWIFSGYPIYTACQFIYRLIHGEPEPEPVDEE